MCVLPAHDENLIHLADTTTHFRLPVPNERLADRPVRHLERRIRITGLPDKQVPEVFIVIIIEGSKNARSCHGRREVNVAMLNSKQSLEPGRTGGSLERREAPALRKRSRHRRPLGQSMVYCRRPFRVAPPLSVGAVDSPGGECTVPRPRTGVAL